MPATGATVILDIGNPTDLHPRNKLDVGRRLALLARAKTYGETGLEYSGPVFDRVEFSDHSARLFWKHATGLRARKGAKEIKGIELAGADGICHPATAKIDGDTILATSGNVQTPLSVRYAWSDNPETNLENAAALPAAPFRTDHP